MYVFEDLSKRRLVLRPESTAGVLRHFMQNQEIKKYFYAGPMYRYERPQTGRFRQFFQLGVENIELKDSSSVHDAEIILLASEILKKLLPKSNITLEINSLGSGDTQKKYNEALTTYFSQKDILDNLSDLSKTRLENKNPLRILDSKNATDQELSKNSPKMNEFYDEESKEKFERVLKSLEQLEIPYKLNSRLCRGLDYYSHTCFEFKVNDPRLGKTQNTVLAGGRYDLLAQYLGNKTPIPAVGWAAGIDRLMLLLDEPEVVNRPFKVGLTYLADKGEDSQYAKFSVLKTAHKISKIDNLTLEILTKEGANLGKKIDHLFGVKNCDLIVMLGQKELDQNKYTLRDKNKKVW